MVQILINIFRTIKIKIKIFGISYHNYIFFQYYNDLIKLFLLVFLLTFLVNLLCWYKRYSIFLISIFNLFELFPVFICDSNIGCLVNNFFEVKIFNHFLLLLLFDILVVVCQINQQILINQSILCFQTTHYNYILQEISF